MVLSESYSSHPYAAMARLMENVLISQIGVSVAIHSGCLTLK